jgi:hypothetical protein
MVGRKNLEAFPKKLARGVGNGEISETFIVEQGVGTGCGEADRAEEMGVSVLHDLKFREAINQFVRRQVHGHPQRFELGQIVRGRPTDTKRQRVHDKILTQRREETRRRKI